MKFKDNGNYEKCFPKTHAKLGFFESSRSANELDLYCDFIESNSSFMKELSQELPKNIDDSISSFSCRLEKEIEFAENNKVKENYWGHSGYSFGVLCVKLINILSRGGRDSYILEHTHKEQAEVLVCP
jgi:hypothetical protein